MLIIIFIIIIIIIIIIIQNLLKIYFKLAIYHGKEQVSEEICTEKIDFEKSNRDATLKLRKKINMKINIKNLHRCAKLCICLYSISKKKKVKAMKKLEIIIFYYFN
jgi:hypothetical protein